MRTRLLVVASALALAACGGGDDRADKGAVAATATEAALVANDAKPVADDMPRPVMQAQVVLDRLGFSPGVVDGNEGASTRLAIEGFQEANGIPVTGQLDAATLAKLEPHARIPATRVIRVPDAWVKASYTPIPDAPEAKAARDAMSYESLWERIAERFHTTPEAIVALNPELEPAPPPVTEPASKASPPAPGAARDGAAAKGVNAPAPLPMLRAGQPLRVPNVGGDRVDPKAVSNEGWRATLTMLGVGNEQPAVDRIVVSKGKGRLQAFSGDRLVAQYAVTTGSEKDPLPLGDWEVKGVAFNPTYLYNPELFWDVSNDKEKLTYPAGPNSPVGVVWIDLNKPHYGIHGTPAPHTIGRAESYGCVRLTNWDAARLAQMVKPGVKVAFVA